MSTYYESPNMNGLQEPQVHKASQACMSCRKQKRKCSKTLPACALCERMNRHCDYSDSSPPPTSEDFNALRMKLMDLETRLIESRMLGANGAMNQPAPYATPSSTLSGPQEMINPQVPSYTSPQDIPWQGLQNRFPVIAFLDREAFKYGGVPVPKPSVEIPIDALELLGDGSAVEAIITEYFVTVHKWMPIFSEKRFSRNMANPMWDAGPDLALLFLCMKLVTSRPQDGIESSQNPIYVSAKRFIAVMEATGTASLLVLQANLLVFWYEFGQAIYPAAWMSAGWCVRYGNMLGISGHEQAVELLGQLGTWTEQEERRRTWWGVLLADRIVSIGSYGYITNAQEPKANSHLPANDSAWETGDLKSAIPKGLSIPIEDPVGPFPRLCQAYILMGKVFHHHHNKEYSSDTERYAEASQLYGDISNLARQITNEIASSNDLMSLAAPAALTFSTLCALCDKYSCPTHENVVSSSPEAAAMQVKAIEGLTSVSVSIVEFAQQLDAICSMPQDLDRLSPIIMDSLYSAAAHNAWLVRESGNESNQIALEALRNILRRFGSRWRSAAEYLRFLDAQEFTYAVGSAAT